MRTFSREVAQALSEAFRDIEKGIKSCTWQDGSAEWIRMNGGMDGKPTLVTPMLSCVES